MDIKQMRMLLDYTQSQFAARYHIPFRTLQNWEAGKRVPPKYILEMLERCVRNDMINRRTAVLPTYNPQKLNLPKRSDFVGAISWLKAVQEVLGKNAVFALDDALMCQEMFGGRDEESIVWIYGNDSLMKYNGVVVLGSFVPSFCVKNRDGLLYTDFNRTISDAFANESILDMQGITEAVSKYYYTNGESLSGIFISPEYQERFSSLAEDAISYYG